MIADARELADRAARSARVRVWDPATRLFHWALVALIISAYCTRNFIGDATLFWHRVNGYAIIALLVFRLLWGIVGSSTARFSAFPPNPVAAVHYALALVRGRRPHYLGHNPLGGLLIYAMVLAVAAQAGTGLFTSDDSFAQGPLVDHVGDRMVSRLSALHAKIFWVIVGLAALHVAANLVYQYGFKDRLIDAMLGGRKPRAAFVDGEEARFAPVSRALVCFGIAVAVVIAGLKLAGQNLLR
jgi:cytochrome b